jgi:hypothetical protein
MIVVLEIGVKEAGEHWRDLRMLEGGASRPSDERAEKHSSEVRFRRSREFFTGFTRFFRIIM